MGKGNQVKMLQRPLGETWVCLRECKMVAMGAFGVMGIKEQGLDPNCCVPPGVALGRVPTLSHHGSSLSKGWMLLLTGTGSVKLRSWGALHEMTATVIDLKTLLYLPLGLALGFPMHKTQLTASAVPWG